MGQLADAVKAYRAAERAVERAEAAAAERVKAVREQRTRARLALAEAIVEARLAGTRPIDLQKETGYSRERIRTILRAAGVEPDE
jgi:hypothetical protein